MLNDKRVYFIITVVAGLFFIPFLGGVHLFDWDEINFAELSREMLITGDYLHLTINFEPFWEKPPLFIWMQVVSMKIFGINEFAARFPNAVCGILTLIALYHYGKKLFNKRFALIWTLSFFGSLLPAFYFRSGIIDPWFNLLIFLSLIHFVAGYWKQKELFKSLNQFSPTKNYIVSGILLGLAVLTKGPAALLIAGGVVGVYMLYKRFNGFVSAKAIGLVILVSLAIPMIWFGIDYLQNGPWFVKTFATYQWRLFSTPDAGHGGFPGYHLVVLLVGCFPISIFALAAFKNQKIQETHIADLKIWMFILLAVVVILFSIVQSKIVHYSSLGYFPITFLGSLVIYYAIERKRKISNAVLYGLLAVGGLFISLCFILPHFGAHPDQVRHLFENDRFTLESLDAPVVWSFIHTLPGILLGLVLLATIYFWRKLDYFKSIKILFIGTAVFLWLGLVMYVDRIESYSQNAAIEFFKEHADEDAYYFVHGYKSYAHLFYTGVEEYTHPRAIEKNWLLVGEIDKRVYCCAKPIEIQALTDLKFTAIGSKNGFYFFMRDPVTP